VHYIYHKNPDVCVSSLAEESSPSASRLGGSGFYARPVYEICVVHSGSRMSLSQITSVFPSQYHSTRESSVTGDSEIYE
jgi:hypothetical protein